MCKYCENPIETLGADTCDIYPSYKSTLAQHEKAYLVRFIDLFILQTDTDDAQNHSVHSIPVSFCPHCGRKLTKNADAPTEPGVIPQQTTPNWWRITYTDGDGIPDPHRKMSGDELRRIGDAVAAGAVSGRINPQ